MVAMVTSLITLDANANSLYNPSVLMTPFVSLVTPLVALMNVLILFWDVSHQFYYMCIYRDWVLG